MVGLDRPRVHQELKKELVRPMAQTSLTPLNCGWHRGQRTSNVCASAYFGQEVGVPSPAAKIELFTVRIASNALRFVWGFGHALEREELAYRGIDLLLAVGHQRLEGADDCD